MNVIVSNNKRTLSLQVHHVDVSNSIELHFPNEKPVF